MPRIRNRTRLSSTAKFFAIAMTLLLVCGFAYLIFEVWMLQIFSPMQIGVAAAFLILLLIALSAGLFRKRTGTVARVVLVLVSALCVGVSTVGGYYVQQTAGFFSSIGTSDPIAVLTSGGKNNSQQNAIANEAAALGEKMAITLTTYSRKTAECYKPSDLSDKKVGVVSALDKDGTDDAVAQLTSKGMKNAELVEYTDQFSLVDGMYANEVDAIILPEQYHADLLEAADDSNRYGALTTFSNTIDQYIYYDEIPEDMKNKPDSVKNITKDPFVVMISGSDTYGTLSAKSRTDVNMLAAVNPQTHQVLLVSLPRDSYMPFSCDKNEDACGYAAGQYDKLTHSGIYGIGTTESSIEDFLDIPINYTVQVNFSSLINVVDAIGGIDVTVEPGLEVETFYSNGTEGVHAGVNHLEGERALAFARERHAYEDGDNQRIKNQQIVMKALMKQMLSPAMLVNYPDFLRALSTAFTTNMPSSQIRDLIRLEVSSFPSWNIQSYALAGDAAEEYSAALNAYAFVTLVYEDDIDTAHDLIEDVLKGRTPAVPQDSTSSQTSKEVRQPDSSQSRSSQSDTQYGEDYDHDYTQPEAPGYTAPGTQNSPADLPDEEQSIFIEEEGQSDPVYEEPLLPEPDVPLDPAQ